VCSVTVSHPKPLLARDVLLAPHYVAIGIFQCSVESPANMSEDSWRSLREEIACLYNEAASQFHLHESPMRERLMGVCDVCNAALHLEVPDTVVAVRDADSRLAAFAFTNDPRGETELWLSRLTSSAHCMLGTRVRPTAGEAALGTCSGESPRRETRKTKAAEFRGWA
jgi:hypothetical protein